MMIELKSGFSFNPEKIVAIEKIDEKSSRILFEGNEITVDMPYKFILSMIGTRRSYQTTQVP